MTEALTPIGYFAKQTAVPDTWTYAPSVTSICSVSTHIGSAPPGWMDRWIHNDWGFFASPADARSVVPEGALDFTLFAYRLLPRRFTTDAVEPLELDPLDIAPFPPSFQCVGFDCVSRSYSAFFECSPLSCNGMAKKIPVNEFCLLNSLEEAIKLAQRFAKGGAEPGPYYVIEVLRGSD